MAEPAERRWQHVPDKTNHDWWEAHVGDRVVAVICKACGRTPTDALRLVPNVPSARKRHRAWLGSCPRAGEAHKHELPPLRRVTITMPGVTRVG